MLVTRLRQVVVAAAELEPTVSALQTAFGLGEAFADPGVAEFGLINGVLPVGDQFVEVVTPSTGSTAAGRWMERGGGDRGYMVIVQVASFKLTGKRVFRMAPIHHHFEHLGWTESQVVIRFWIISFVLALIGLSSLKLR